ncbi:hypothetical protein LOTGIDRAFT_163087 [Lottia gigantea]|uniref:NXPE C-terminal domain-containing protein n=1 Tax=Lottia gigantea TaxID=225164 RepID=V4AFD6_LOTGI|nr:hypothetical protein LOTGIDRAFT_163087 [Lottia gigantea]ESO92081.1 hypothetical protein LOTGIDRAFT_163087 [Lottia gigantea]
MASGCVRIPRQLYILMTFSCVAVLFLEFWLPQRHNRRDLSNLLKNDNERHHKTAITGVAYGSFKPDTCLFRKLKPHCFDPNDAHYLNQSRDIDQACFPEDVVFTDIGLDDPFFPSTDLMMPMEKETMNDPEYFDMFNTVSLEKSKVILEEPNKRHHIGDVIGVRVDLVNRLSKPRTLGGDDVRALMVSEDKLLRTGGNVTDLKNGSYQITFEALRQGNNTVIITIPYTREIRATMFKWLRRHKTLIYYFGVFKRNDVQEFTLCSPYSTIPGFVKVCNLTAMNDDLPWFCGSPVTPELPCDTIVKSERFDYAEITANYAQYSAFYRSHLKTNLKSSITVNVHKGHQSKQSNKINCNNRINPRDTWNTTMSTGYVYKQQWIQRNCTNTVTRKSAVLCLVNTTLFLTGDSTVHHWLKFVVKMTNSKRMPLKWALNWWTDNGIYVNKQLNITIQWAPHVLPFVRARKLPDRQMNLKSVSTHLKQLPTSGRIIFLIHFFAHFTRQHYSLFWIHIRSLKPAIREALNRNKDLKLAIKSPHMFYRSPCLPILNDLQAPIFIDIIQEEFVEFKDSMIYLNYWEMNHVLQNDEVHPPYPIIWQNLRHLLSYVC